MFQCTKHATGTEAQCGRLCICTLSEVICSLQWYWHGVIQKNVLNGGSTKTCSHNCDQVLIEAAGDLYSIHTLVSWC